jgi:hypothetical protein
MSWRATKSSTEMNACRFKFKTRPLLLLLLLAIGLGAVACTSTDPDNEAIKPWDSPEGWQNGQLQMMQQQGQH